MSAALAGETYRLETVDTAESAIRKLPSISPDLILLDSHISTSDGTRLATRLLADEALAAIPIVALTAAGAGRRDNQPDGRFDGHIEKPINPDTLPGRVLAFLESPEPVPPNQPAGLALPATRAGDRRKQASEVLDAIAAGLPDSQFAPATLTSLQALTATVGRFQHSEVDDYLLRAERLSSAATARARSRFGSMIRLCRELVQREPDVTPALADLRVGYIENRVAELDGLVQSLKKGDFAALRKAGHNLKGTGASYGFGELTDIGKALEAAAKANDAAASEVLLDQIEAYISIVRPSHKE